MQLIIIWDFVKNNFEQAFHLSSPRRGVENLHCIADCVSPVADQEVSLEEHGSGHGFHLMNGIFCNSVLVLFVGSRSLVINPLRLAPFFELLQDVFASIVCLNFFDGS